MIVILVLLLACVVWFGGAALAMLVWNATLPSLFHWPEVTYWQMFALLFLLSLITGGFKVRLRK